MNQFSENQKFNALWVKLIIALLFVACWWPIIATFSSNGPIPPMPAVIFLFVIPVLISLIFVFGYLNTVIDDTGISVNMRIVIKFSKTFRWTEIDSLDLKPYRPIMEFGGWGYRLGIGGTAYTTSGNMGLIVKLKNGKRVVIGTQKVDELKSFLIGIGKISD